MDSAREDLATLSTNSVHRVIDGANHGDLSRTKRRRRHHSSDPRRHLSSGAAGQWAGDRLVTARSAGNA